MNNIQKILKDMVVVSLSNEEIIEEAYIDKLVDEIKNLPMFSTLTLQDIDEIRAVIKADFSIKLDKGEGVYSFGNGLYYFAYAFKTEEKKNGGIIRLCHRTEDPQEPFAPYEA